MELREAPGDLLAGIFLPGNGIAGYRGKVGVTIVNGVNGKTAFAFVDGVSIQSKGATERNNLVRLMDLGIAAKIFATVSPTRGEVERHGPGWLSWRASDDGLPMSIAPIRIHRTAAFHKTDEEDGGRGLVDNLGPA